MNRFGKVSVIAASTMLPVSLLISNFVGWQLKSSNTANVDITAGLAYLRPILITGFSIFAVFLITAIVAAVIGMRKDQDSTLSKIGIFITVVVLVLTAGLAVVNNATANVIDSYKTEQQ